MWAPRSEPGRESRSGVQHPHLVLHDQPVIDHIASDWSGPDKVRLEVHKIVEGQQEFMGTLDCTQRADAILSCTGNTPKKDAWEFSFLFRACRNFGVQLFESDVLQFLYWSSSFLVSMIGGVVIVCSAIQQTLTPPRPRVLSKTSDPPVTRGFPGVSAGLT